MSIGRARRNGGASAVGAWSGPTGQPFLGCGRLVEQRAAQFPAVPIADLGYDRCQTDLAEVIALLLYVDRDRAWVPHVECPLLLSGYESIDWPERADEVWQNRARVLLRYARHPMTTARAVNVLGMHARTGWDLALAWLDRLATEQAAEVKASNVVDLASWRDEHARCP